MPSPSSLNRNRYLENFSTAAFSIGGVDGAQGFLARKVPSLLPVDDDVGKYYEMNNDDVMRDEFNERAPGTLIAQSDWKLGDATYAVKQYAYGQKLPEEYTHKPDLQIEEAHTAVANERALISMEVRFRNVWWKTGVWGRDVTGIAAAPNGTQRVFWNLSSSTPVDDFVSESLMSKLAGWRRPNTLALGANVAAALLTNAQITGRLNNGQTPGGPAAATMADLAKLFGVERVFVADAIYNAAKEGANVNRGFILDPKSAWLGYVAPRMTKYTLTAGATITWRGNAGNDQGVRVFRRWDDSVRSWIIEVIHDDVQKIMAPTLGTFFSAIVQ